MVEELSYRVVSKMVRQPSWNKTCVKKGTWSPDEDQKLIAYILRYGIWNWNEMPKYAGLQRSGKSCRLRWMNYLRPNIKRGNFTREEEETVIQLQKLLGNRWSAIAARLPQRTDNDIKNHWNTRLKKREFKKYNSSPATKSSKEINSSFKFEQENSSDADSSMSLNIFLDSQIPTMGDIPELAAYSPFSPSGCNNTVVADNMYTMEDNFVSSDNFCEIRSFLEQPQTIEVLEEDCEAMLPNSQLWLHEPICACDSSHEPVDDFWVNPFI